MSDLGDLVKSILADAAGGILNVADKVRNELDDKPFEIVAYRGYGSAQKAHVYGRVIQKRSIGPSTARDSLLRNLLNTYRRVDSDPLPFAEVRLELGDATIECRSDNEGFFGGWIEPSKAIEGEWARYDVELPGAGEIPAIKGDGKVLVPTDSARFCVVSDIDDTVIQSRVSNFLQAARTVMLGNARTRLPFPGVAAFYQALRNGATGDEKNPIFYVSSSPWNIYDVIGEFMDLQKIPAGPLVLRDWDISLSALSASRHFAHKGEAIRNLMTLYPAMQFILIGDTSQHDPEIYRQIVGEFPERVRAIYIRDVNRNAERTKSIERLAEEVLEAGSTLVLAEDTLAAAKHAAEHGWISGDSLPEVHEEKKADEGRTDEKAPAPDGGKPGSGEPAKVIGG